VPPEGARAQDRIRTAEIMAALSLATDLGMGLPYEHALHSTMVAMRLAERLGVDAETASATYYTCLLFHIGCTTDAEREAELFREGALMTHFNPVMFGSSTQTTRGIVRALADPDTAPPFRTLQAISRFAGAARGYRQHMVALCEVAQMLTDRLGLPEAVQNLFAHLTERWDGKGQPAGISGEQLPLPLRIADVARDAEFQRLLGGEEHAARVIRERAGHAFDPAIAGLLADEARTIFAGDVAGSVWDEALAREPGAQLALEGAAIDRALAAMGDFADLASRYLVGHSAGVADLAAAAGRQTGLDGARCLALRRAALVHDVGRVAISTRIWQKEGRLTTDEWEQIRLHAYHTERILHRSPFLAAIAPVSTAHHERLDGTGYHRGAAAVSLAPPMRLLAAADAYHAMTEPRPHRPPLSPAEAGKELANEVEAGRLDAVAVAAVLEAAGQHVRRPARPAGLTEREAVVVVMLARGLQTKQIARALGISPKTADHHIQNAYGKIGVSTRPAATLFAMEHGLLAWGALPMSSTAVRS
jgi:HD-GYP domain-containing protein (c-di-GMP phosphodiesterase class II)